jgi:tetratricopeptide (TPR) repeat protein
MKKLVGFLQKLWRAPGLHAGRWVLGGLAVSVAAAAVYANTLGHGFVWDDRVLIVENPFVQAWSNVRALLSPSYFLQYPPPAVENGARPVWVLSALLDCRLWGLQPWGHHLTNVLLHSVNSALVFALAGLLASSLPAALLAGALFALHPVHTEAVAMVGFRADLLAAFFLLAAFVLFKTMERSGERAVGARGVALRGGLLGASVALYGFGLLSKEMAVTLPALLLLHDLAFRPGASAREALRRAPVYGAYLSLLPGYLVFHALRFDYRIGNAMSVWLDRVAGWLTFAAPASAAAIPSPTVSVAQSLVGDPLANFLTMSRVFADYVRLMAWPYPLRAEYAVVPAAVADPSAWAAAALIGLALVAAAAAARRFPLAAFGAIAFFVSLAPVSNWQPLYNLQAERYLYLPSIFACLALAPLGAWAFSLAGARRAAALTVIGAVLSCAAGWTVARNGVWKDERTLWEATVRQSPDAARAWYNLGYLEQQDGRLEQARAHYEKALRLNPGYVEARANLAELLAAQLRPEAAEAVYRAGAVGGAKSLITRMNLANLLLQRGKWDEAAGLYRAIQGDSGDDVSVARAASLNLAKCLAFLGDDAGAEQSFARAKDGDAAAQARYELAEALARAGRDEASMKQYRRLLESRPDHGHAWADLGVLLHHAGRLSEAERALANAVRLLPGSAVALYDLGTVYNDLSELSKAEELLRRAVALQPDYSDAHYNLAVVLQRKGDLTGAARSYERVLEFTPNRAEALTNLGGCYERLGDLRRAEPLLRRAVQIDGTRSYAFVNLGTVCRRLGRVEEAVSLYQQAIRVNPADGMAYHNLGLCYLGAGELGKARQEFESALQVTPRLVEARYQLGVVSFKLGDARAAVRSWQTALQIQPDHGPSLRALEAVRAQILK